jgi:hypothetical protein
MYYKRYLENPLKRAEVADFTDDRATLIVRTQKHSYYKLQLNRIFVKPHNQSESANVY